MSCSHIQPSSSWWWKAGLIFLGLCGWKRAAVVFPGQNTLGLNGKYLVQNEGSSWFHYHKITAASRYLSTDRQQDLISCCGWLTFTETALFDSVSRKWLWTLKFRGFVVVWRSWWPWCFQFIRSNIEEFPPLSRARSDQNVEWKFHCTNWLSPMDFFSAINESFSVVLEQLETE